MKTTLLFSTGLACALLATRTLAATDAAASWYAGLNAAQQTSHQDAGGRARADAILHAARHGLAARTDVVVSDTVALEDALAQSHAGERIIVLAATYELSAGLYVPDGVTLVGEGLMEFDPSGLPTGIAPAGRTVLKSTAGLTGDVITLGNGAGLQGLVIEDFEGRRGNVVTISSRASGDSVAAWIFQCELITRSPIFGSPGGTGPIGRGVLLVTRNPNLDANPPPHDGSELALRMSESVVRSPVGGSAVLALNFASHCRITVHLRCNVLGGGLDSAAGVSWPDPVSNSSIEIKSFNNLFRSDSPQPTLGGWLLAGGTDAPVPSLVPAGATRGNQLELVSIHDRIEGFGIGVYARAGRRNSPLAGVISENLISLNVTGLKLATVTSDLSLYGDFSFVAGMSAGDGNVVHAVLHDVTGSGARGNRYEDSSTSLGSDNMLVIRGSSTAFGKTNRNIVPAPPAQFFTSGR